LAWFLKTHKTRNWNHSKHFLNKNIWVFKESKSALVSSDQDQSIVFIKNCFLELLLELWSWLRQFLHWFDHQTKPSIPFLYYFCNLLYRSACIVETVIILSLYWRLFCCELPGLVILFCTVSYVQVVTCWGDQQGVFWNIQWSLYSFGFCCRFSRLFVAGSGVYLWGASCCFSVNWSSLIFL